MTRYLLLGACSFLLFCGSLKSEDLDEKLEAYSLVSKVLPQLESQLHKLNKSIEFAEGKVKSSANPKVKGLFEEQLTNLEEQRDATQSKIDEMNSLIGEMIKDPEVGSLIQGQEANRKLKQSLDKVSSALPDNN
jgi:hypothetical protein